MSYMLVSHWTMMQFGMNIGLDHSIVIHNRRKITVLMSYCPTNPFQSFRNDPLYEVVGWYWMVSYVYIASICMNTEDCPLSPWVVLGMFTARNIVHCGFVNTTVNYRREQIGHVLSSNVFPIRVYEFKVFCRFLPLSWRVAVSKSIGKWISRSISTWLLQCAQCAGCK